MLSRPRLLLIDENPEDRALAEFVLMGQYPGAIVHHAGDGSEFLEALDQGFYDIVVTEFDTTWGRGSFLLQAIHDHQPRAAILVFTHCVDRQAAVDALRSGAADFVIKSSAGFLDLRRAVSEALPELTRDQPLRDPGTRVSTPRLPEAVGGWAIPAASHQKPVSEPIPAGDPMMQASPTAAPQVAEPVSGSLHESDRSPEIGSEPAGRVAEASVEPQPELFREAVESARQSISNVAHRPLGAVLGIIAILAAFIVLYATFFGDGSDSVEAGAPAAVVSAEVGDESTRPAVEPPVAEPREVTEAPSGGVEEPLDPTPSRVTPDEPPVRSAPAPVALELRAESEVWVQVSVDGIPVFDAVLAPGQTQRFEGRQMATLLIGNAAGLSVVWNGEDIGSLGREGQVRRLYFSPSEVGVGSPPS